MLEAWFLISKNTRLQYKMYRRLETDDFPTNGTAHGVIGAKTVVRHQYKSLTSLESQDFQVIINFNLNQ